MRRSSSCADRWRARWLVLPLFVCVAACESAQLVDGGRDAGPREDVSVPVPPPPPDDLGPRDSGPPDDLGPPEDSGPPDDLGPPDMGRAPAPPDPPAPPTAPARRPAILSSTAWLNDTEPATLLVADPGIVAPDPPSFGTCAPWFSRSSAGGGIAHCEPWPPSGHPDCADVGSAHFPGASACLPIGPACPVSGDFASDVPMTGTVLYVDPSAAMGGTGTRASPFHTLDAAFAAPGVGGGPVVIALAGGTYTGPITVPAGVTLWGACPRSTIITGMSNAPTVQIPAGGGRGLRNLRVTGGSVGIDTSAASTLTLRAVVADGSAAPLLLRGTTIADDLVVRDARRSAPPSSDDGHGVTIEAMGSITLHRGVIERSEGAGLLVRGTAALEDVAVLGAERGVHLRAGPAFLAVRLVVEETTREVIFAEGPVAIDVDVLVMRDDEGGISIFTEGAPTAQLRRIFAERVTTLIAAPGPFALSDAILRVNTDGGADAIQVWVTTATLDRVRVEGARGRGLSVWEGAQVTATSLVVNGAGEGVYGGEAIRATDHARLTLRRVEIDGAHTSAIGAGGCLDMCYPERLGQDTLVDAEDVRIRGVVRGPSPGLAGAWGLLVTGGATMTVTRASIEPAVSGAAAVGFASLGIPETLAAGTLELHDCVVRPGLTVGGASITAVDGGEVTLDRSVIVGWAGRALDASGDSTTLEVTDSVIADVTSPPIGEGAGASVRNGATATIDHALFLRIADIGVRAESADTVVSLTDSEIEHIGDGPSEHDGVGLLASDGAVVALERVAMSDLARAGIDLSGAGTTMTATDVSVSAVHGLVDGSGGYGVLVSGGAAATLGGALVRDAHECGMLVAERGSMLTASDVTVEGSADAGQGIVALAGGNISLQRALIDAARGAGVASFGSGASLMAANLRVTSTTEEACAADLCAATGVGVYDGAVLDVSEFVIQASARCGAHLATNARAVLAAGVVAGAEICVALRAGVVPESVLTDVLLRDCATRDLADTAVRPTTPTVVRAR